MNVLNDIKQAIKVRMQSHSMEALEAVDKAAKVVRYLHLHRCTVQQITVRPNHITIEIDPPPAGWLKGSIHISRINGSHREIVKVAPVLGCQVQWTEREAHALLRQEG